jgi:uncharacterized membrane protein YqgA involved in biofilm formation
MLIPVGTLVNVAAIIAGGLAGLILHDRLPVRVKSIVFQGLGLCVLVIGMQMALTMSQPLVVIFSVLLGGVTGAALRLEQGFERLGDWLKAKVKSKNASFTDGMVTASLIYCIGSLAILGAFDEGLRGDPTLLFTKSMLDGFASIALAATYGVGVVFSIIPVFVYQYSLTILAASAQDLFTQAMIAQLTATGGVLILGIGVNLLELKRIPLSNLLPALVYAVLIQALFG